LHHAGRQCGVEGRYSCEAMSWGRPYAGLVDIGHGADRPVPSARRRATDSPWLRK
jgi:hypothetical protein